MKKCFILLAVLCVLCIGGGSAYAASPAPGDIQVEITSPSSVDDVPIHNDVIEVTVTNLGQQRYENLSCYLSITDLQQGQSYPTEEFGENAFQTRTIPVLAPGESAKVSIPVRILYVGDFRFAVSVLDDATGRITTGDALHVRMHAVSTLHKTPIMLVAAIVPLLLAAAALLLTRKKKAAA